MSPDEEGAGHPRGRTFLARGTVRAIQVLQVDRRRREIIDTDGVRRPADPRALDKGFRASDWMVTTADGVLARYSDVEFRKVYEPIGGWDGEEAGGESDRTGTGEPDAGA